MPSNDPTYQSKYIKKHYQDNKEYYREKARQRKAELLPKRKAIIARYKTMKGCVDCGFNSHPEALDFDHLRDKEFLVSAGVNGMIAWSRIKAEVAKCEVRCANCHRIKTAERRSTPSS